MAVPDRSSLTSLSGDLATRFWPAALAAAICIAIVGPWLWPGYVFATDFSGPRHFSFPTAPTSFAPLQVALALLGSIFEGSTVGKMLIIAILFSAAFFAYQAAPTIGFVPRAAASLVYTFNPFVYDRISYGQLTVLAGYSLLPLVALSVRRLLLRPNAAWAGATAASLAAVASVDIHFVVISALLFASLGAAHAFARIPRQAYIFDLSRNVALTVVLFAVLQAYWIIPTLRGESVEAHTLSRITDADLAAFGSASDSHLGLLLNIVGLYGFWAERTDRYVSLKDFVPQWPLILAFMLLVCSIGIVVGVRAPGATGPNRVRALVIGLALAAAASTVLAIGISEPHTARLVRWIDSVAPAYRGMRDASKWIAVIALFYSQTTALGVAALLEECNKRVLPGVARDSLIAVVTAVALAAPLYYGSGLLYGAHGQIRPSSYPPGWYSADHLIASDPSHPRTLFLPWHGYIALSFVHNTDQVVANPAPLFFSTNVLASSDLEIPGIAPPAEPDQRTISKLVASGAEGEWATILAAQDVKYVLIAREADWMKYSYFANLPGLELVSDYNSILLYRDAMWTGSG